MAHQKIVFVTGSSGLIGSEVCLFYHQQGFRVHGVDNNQRALFFGPQGDTRWNRQRLLDLIPGFVHHELDIRDRPGMLALVRELKPDAIIHTAAQPSHDRARIECPEFFLQRPRLSDRLRVRLMVDRLLRSRC